MSLAYLEHSPILKLKQVLDSKFGRGAWARFEPETIALEYNEPISSLLLDKISLLRVLEVSPLQPFEDPALFLYAAEVINNTPADFDSVPFLTMLEAAYAIVSISAVLRDNKVIVEYPVALQKSMAYTLNLDGASEPIYPFEFVPASELEKGQTPSDTEAKKKAIAMYIKHMESL